MHNLRKYGKPPFRIALIHGGPGAAGEMAPVARELASDWGILEPLQTAVSVSGQVKELWAVLQKHADIPVILVGFSWGAWLSFMLAADHPAIVRKLILIGSGSYEEKYAARIYDTRLSRLSKEDRAEVESIVAVLNDPAGEGKDETFARFGALLSYADAYDPIPHESEAVECCFDIFQGVSTQAAEFRRTGKLLELGRRIECPVVAIHGDYDPHPAEGVERPLSAVLKSFRFILLRNCGHMPWIERQARDEFYRVLKDELR
ncbi:MAG: alpha/beta hydrolase [Chloroflexi bacterium]|nr:alpha/beta hydrolase [Chloroflexota bacterium]